MSCGCPDPHSDETDRVLHYITLALALAALFIGASCVVMFS